MHCQCAIVGFVYVSSYVFHVCVLCGWVLFGEAFETMEHCQCAIFLFVYVSSHVCYVYVCVLSVSLVWGRPLHL